MKKGMILYRSKYGAAKKYAGWMAEATGFDITEVRWANPVQMQDCGTVLLFGGIYASGIAGLSFFRKHWQELRGKQLAVFCVGASPYEENAFRAVREHNMRGELAGIHFCVPEEGSVTGQTGNIWHLFLTIWDFPGKWKGNSERFAQKKCAHR